jgi:phosphopantetheine--protein transferase-like protein
MKIRQPYCKHIDIIKKEDFMTLFSDCKNPEDMFSYQELKSYPFPGGTRSLAGRYLIKKRIHQQIGETGSMHEIEILNDAMGKPEISVSQSIQQALRQSGITSVLCSISHSRNLITGMTIFCF